MTLPDGRRRALATMVAYGYPEVDLDLDLAVARRLGASAVEVLPLWHAWPDPDDCRRRLDAAGLRVHSAHGSWGGQSVRAPRVDLGSTDRATWRASVDDLRLCLDWLTRAGGTHLVVHPGGLSDPAETAARRDALAEGLRALADHVKGAGVVVCVENMPPGVHPGSRMDDLADIVAAIARPDVGLALDTGHAHISASVGSETRASGALLRTTHVHDNPGRQDVHLPPGLGSIDWPGWAADLDAIGYQGPIVLECIRHLRSDPAVIDGSFLERLGLLCGASF